MKIISYLWLLSFCALAFGDNEISIEQTGGDNFSLNIEQYGANNEIKMYDTSSYLNGSNLSLHFYQNNNGTYQNLIDLFQSFANKNRHNT